MSPDKLDMNLTEWKETFLPKELNHMYQMAPSQCKMYKVTEENLDDFVSGRIAIDNTTETIACSEVIGYDYDQSEMTSTAVTDNDWVCDKAARPTDLFTIGTAGVIVGVFFFSAFADWKGRRPAFFISTLFMIILNIIPIWISHDYTAFAIVKVLAFATMMPLFQCPLNITTEISSVAYRAFAIGYGCIAWSIGWTIMPFIAWGINR